jgi:hypothetical protein
MTTSSDNQNSSLSHFAGLSGQELNVLGSIRSSLQNLLKERPFRVILFGSKARGDWDSDSDLDLAIIVDHLDRDLKHAIFDAIADVELEYLFPVSSFVLSTEEFNRLRSRERRIALDIEQDGIPL